jgi:hypothetical protein
LTAYTSTRRYQTLNPIAFGVAAACAEVFIAVLVGFPMISMMPWSGAVASEYQMYGAVALSLGVGLGGAFLAAAAGMTFASVYNAISAADTSDAGDGDAVSGVPDGK